MDDIIRRLFEARNVISTHYFNLDNRDDEHYDLMDAIEMRLRDARDRLFDDVDIDDSGMNGYGSTDGDRTIVYQCEFYHSEFDGKSAPKKRPLSNKEWKELQSDLLQSIRLPEEDDNYEYKVSCKYEGTILKIRLNRAEK